MSLRVGTLTSYKLNKCGKVTAETGTAAHGCGPTAKRWVSTTYLKRLRDAHGELFVSVVAAMLVALLVVSRLAAALRLID